MFEDGFDSGLLVIAEVQDFCEILKLKAVILTWSFGPVQASFGRQFLASQNRQFSASGWAAVDRQGITSHQNKEVEPSGVLDGFRTVWWCIEDGINGFPNFDRHIVTGNVARLFSRSSLMGRDCRDRTRLILRRHSLAQNRNGCKAEHEYGYFMIHMPLPANPSYRRDLRRCPR